MTSGIHDWRLLPSVAAVWATAWLLNQHLTPRQVLIWGLVSALVWLGAGYFLLLQLPRKTVGRHHPQQGKGWWAAESVRAAAALGCLTGVAAAGIATIHFLAPAVFVQEYSGKTVAVQVQIEGPGTSIRNGATRYRAHLRKAVDPDLEVPTGSVWLIVPAQTQLNPQPHLQPGNSLADGDQLFIEATVHPPWGNKVAELRIPQGAQVVPQPPTADAEYFLADVIHLAQAQAVRLRAGLVAASQDFPDFSRGLIPGIAVGNDHDLPATWGNQLRAVSLTHITAVSGAHVAMMVGMVSAAFIWAPRPVQMAVSLGAILGLLWLVQPEPSVIRAAAMGMVVALGQGSGRGSLASTALCASAIVLLLNQPSLSREWGFGLSFAATWGIISWQPVVVRRLHPLPPLVAEVVSVPIAAQLACMPLLLMLEPTIPLYSVPANVLAGVAVPGVTFSALAAAPLVASGQEGWQICGEVLIWIAHAGSAWIAAVAEFFAQLPGAQLPLGYGFLLGSVVLAAKGATAPPTTANRQQPASGPTP